jgi:thioredoxin reductase
LASQQDGSFEPTAEELSQLTPHAIGLERETVVGAEGPEHGIVLRLRTRAPVNSRRSSSRRAPHLPRGFAESLGCDAEIGPAGSFFKTDATTKETSVPGVFACGDAALPTASVSLYARLTVSCKLTHN